MPRPHKLLALLLALAMVLAACGDDSTSTTAPDQEDVNETLDEPGDTPSFPVTVTADNGQVTIDESPTAIVSLSPSITEMLYAVGAGDQVAAVDTYSDFPPEAPTTELSGFRPNVEAIGDLDPDLVFLGRDRDDVVATLESVGVTVVLLEAPVDLDGLADQLQTVGAATGHASAAESATEELRSGVEEIVARVPEDAPTRTYFYELTDEYHTTTSGTFIGAVLGLAGLENIADGADAAAGAYPQLNAEYVLDAAPDVVFLAHGDGSVPSEAELAERPGWSDLLAGGTTVVPLDADIASRWGPRIVELVDQVVTALGH